MCSCKSNLRGKHIKYFNLKKIKLKNNTNILTICKEYFTKGTFFPSLLGEIVAHRDSVLFDLSQIGIKKKYSCDCLLKYDIHTKQYILYVKEQIEFNNIQKLKKMPVKEPPKMTLSELEKFRVNKIKRNKRKREKWLKNKKLQHESPEKYRKKISKNRNRKKNGVSQRTIKKQRRKENKKLIEQEEQKHKKEQDKVEYKKNKIISIDPGLRKFATGITENKVIKFGTNMRKVKKYVLKLQKIDKNKSVDKKKKKKRAKCRRKIESKISRMVDDMHWKSINYLTNTNDNILIGNMSTKGIVKKETSVLRDEDKLLASRIKLSKYRERLEWRCNMNKVNYEMIDESYTSMICSICGYLKEDLGRNEIFNCSRCKKVIDRDVNGARNIYLKKYLIEET